MKLRYILQCFGPGSPVIRSNRQKTQPRVPRKRGMVVFILSWLSGWPALVYAALPLMKQFNAFEFTLLGLGTYVWMISCYVLYDMLFSMAESRWPIATPIRQSLSFLVKMLRAFAGHHHAP